MLNGFAYSRSARLPNARPCLSIWSSGTAPSITASISQHGKALGLRSCLIRRPGRPIFPDRPAPRFRATSTEAILVEEYPPARRRHLHAEAGQFLIPEEASLSPVASASMVRFIVAISNHR